MAVLKLKPEYLVIGAGLIAVTWLAMFKTRLINKLASFIPSVEGFRAHPYWDVSRYSWGYGTKAPGSTGTITRDQAFADMVSYLLSDYDLLKPKIHRQLTVAQWSALLSFSYNLGNDDAVDLVPYINAGDDAELSEQWMKYVHANGVVNSDLVERRKKELALWLS